jgi:hypothetical protein
MLNPIFRKDQLPLLFVTAILLTAGPSSGSPIHRSPQSSEVTSVSSSECFLPDTPVSALVKKKTSGASRYVHSERNGDLVIAIPDVGRVNYRIRFFDVDNHFLFGIDKLEDPLLIIEKYNFQHAGLFQYELYKENLLMERNTFVIKKD